MFRIFEIKKIPKFKSDETVFIAKGQCTSCGVVAVIRLTPEENFRLYRFMPNNRQRKDIEPYFPKCPNCEG